MDTTAGGGGLPGDSVTSPAPVAMETTKLLVGGGSSPAGDSVTSSAGAAKDYGGAQQLSKPAPLDDTGMCTYGLFFYQQYLSSE